MANLSADIELKMDEEEEYGQLQLVILESLVLRRDSDIDPLGGHIHTRLLVEHGQEISPGAVVARTEIQCKEAGKVGGIREAGEAIRRILVVRDADQVNVPINGSALVQEGDLIVAGTEIAPGVLAAESGYVLSCSDEEVVLRLARPYRVSAGAVLHINDGDLVQRGDNLVLLVFERSKTGDIIQGLPRIEELLEARKPKEGCILSRAAGVCQVERQGDDTVDVKVVENDGVVTPYPIAPGQNLLVTDGARVEIGDPITDGPANPHEIIETFFNYYVDQLGVYEAALVAIQKAQLFLVAQVQLVYQSQGIDISDKHIEVIVRQMTNKVRVEDGGDTAMLPGELVELRQIEQVNEAMSITGSPPATYTPVLLGITKASLNTDSFISAASFQETTRVLTEAAIEGKSDWLRGLKENVIIGRLIPAGTGFSLHQDGLVSSEGDYSPNSKQYYNHRTANNLSDSLSENLVFTGFGDDNNEDYEDVVLDDQIARAYTEDAESGDKFSSVLDKDELEDDDFEDDFDEDDEI